MSSVRGSNLVFHLTTSIQSDLIPCLDHPDSHFSKPPPVGPAALFNTAVARWKKLSPKGGYGNLEKPENDRTKAFHTRLGC